MYRGLARTVTDFPVSPRARVWYAAFALDDDDNVSTAVTGSLPRFDPPLYSPLDGAVVRKHAALPLAQGGRARRTTTCRSGAAPRPRRSSRRGRTRRATCSRRKLAKGRYSWYVFPGFGPRSLARYGALLGSGTFVVR